MPKRERVTTKADKVARKITATPKPKPKKAPAIHCILCDRKTSPRDAREYWFLQGEGGYHCERCAMKSVNPVKDYNTQTITIETASVAALKAFAEQMAMFKHENSEIKISTPEQQTAADELLMECRRRRDGLEKLLRPSINDAHKTHKNLVQTLKDQLKPIDEIEAAVRVAVVKYQTTERERREAEVKRLQEEAEKKEKERKDAEAKRLADAGFHDAAAEVAAAPVVAPIVVAPVAVAQSTAVRLQERWRYEITSMEAIPRAYLLVDESAIQKVVNVEKANCRIPGIRVWSEMDSVARPISGAPRAAPRGF